MLLVLVLLLTVLLLIVFLLIILFLIVLLLIVSDSFHGGKCCESVEVTLYLQPPSVHVIAMHIYTYSVSVYDLRYLLCSPRAWTGHQDHMHV